jgi:hypothetical protein
MGMVKPDFRPGERVYELCNLHYHLNMLICNPGALARLFFEKLQWRRAEGIRRRQGYGGHGSREIRARYGSDASLVLKGDRGKLRQLARKNISTLKTIPR